jgi:hypothetical protein
MRLAMALQHTLGSTRCLLRFAVELRLLPRAERLLASVSSSTVLERRGRLENGDAVVFCPLYPPALLLSVTACLLSWQESCCCRRGEREPPALLD